MKSLILKLNILFILLCLTSANAFAQQTIISVPSSEVLPAGQIMFKSSNRFRPFEPDGYASLTPAFTMGIGKGMELSTGVNASIDNDYRTGVRNDISVKKVWFLGSSTRLTVGTTIGPSLCEAVHPNTFLYSHVSQRIKKTRTSITAGAYMNGQEHALNRGGVILGLDQVIIPNKLRFAMDWLSGEDSFGKMGIGLKYRPIPTVSITSAVIVPMKDSDNIAFNVSVSKYISLDDENPIKRRLVKNVNEKKL